MNSNNREVMRKILYAVETGGQVYGNARYDDFTEAYTNSSAEHAITIGAGAWYATEAKRLLSLIREKHPERFRQFDNAEVERDIDTAAWSTYKLSKSSTKAKAIVAIISSQEGVQCQDKLMESQIQEYEQAVTKLYGSMTDGAMMECINIRHQGGDAALKRILAKTVKPYTAATIYAALCTDPADKSNNNQVGDYTTRQEKVYEMIRKYCKEETGMTEQQARQTIVSIMNGWIGLKRSDGSHMAIINLYNSHKPLARGYAVQSGDAYCATTVSAAAIKAGFTDIMPTECGCGQMIELYQKKGRWVENDAYVPDIGDVIFYDWDDSGAGDCTGWPEHVGVVAVVNKSTRKMTITEGNMSGGVVGQRNLEINARYIRGYGVPDYASKAGSSSPDTNQGSSGDTGSTSGSGDINKNPKWTGRVTADTLNVRSWAGTENAKIKSWPQLAEGNQVDVCDTVNDSTGHPWYYIRIAGKFYGFVDSDYIARAGSGSGEAGGSELDYIVGQTYTLQVELKVRTAPGTGSATKSYSQLTTDGKRHDQDRDGCLDAGTQVTCQEIRNVGNDIWMRAPSGWMAAYYQGDKYII